MGYPEAPGSLEKSLWPRFFSAAASGRFAVRPFLAFLLAVTLLGAAYYLLLYVPKHARAGEPVLALANYFLTYAPIQSLHQTEYVIPDSLDVWDTPAEIRARVATLKSGSEVRALGHFRDWTHVRLLDGEAGWVSDDGLMSAETHHQEELLLDAVSTIPAQAAGHTANVSNLHIEPSRRAPLVIELGPDRSLEILGRRVLPRLFEDGASGVMTVSSRHLEAWYLVRTGSEVGWILGRLVQLDFPKGLSAYAQDSNIVAWLPLDTVEDNGRQVPQYVVADRVGTESCDFTHIRVLTWWKKHQTYAIAYREGGLTGYFPILVAREGSVPYFRLRLINDDGSKFQKIYGLFDTITRVTGTADTWESDALPEPAATRARRREASPMVPTRTKVR